MTYNESSGGVPGLPWYVIRVKSNTERVVAQSLTNRGITVFLPLEKRLSKRKNFGMIETPLFPGYVFGQFEYRAALPVVTCPGVVHIICRGTVPEPVDPAEMHSLLVLSQNAVSMSLLPTFAKGQKVRITGGPLADVEAIVLSDNGSRRLILSVTLLRRSVVAQMDRDWIEDVRRAPLQVTSWIGTGIKNETGIF
jgi:transcription antitermination factor NusG